MLNVCEEVYLLRIMSIWNWYCRTKLVATLIHIIHCWLSIDFIFPVFKLRFWWFYSGMVLICCRIWLFRVCEWFLRCEVSVACEEVLTVENYECLKNEIAEINFMNEWCFFLAILILVINCLSFVWFWISSFYLRFCLLIWILQRRLDL